MSSKLKQWSGPALAVDGSLWIALYALQGLIGVATGVPPHRGRSIRRASCSTCPFLAGPSSCSRSAASESAPG
jgi:hypothetical protein